VFAQKHWQFLIIFNNFLVYNQPGLLPGARTKKVNAKEEILKSRTRNQGQMI